MNEKPGMAEDFVLNGNCATTQDQTLKEQLCPKPVVLPDTGSFVAISFLLAVFITLAYAMAKRGK